MHADDENRNPGNALQAAGFQHVDVDQDVVTRDVGVVGGDESDSAHVGRQVEDGVDSAAGGEQAVIELAQVEQLEFMGVARLIFRELEVHSANPVAVGAKTFHKMVPDKSAGAGDKNAHIGVHRSPLSNEIEKLVICDF